MKHFLLLGIPVLAALVGCHNEPLDVAPNVDLRRFQGSWYEIAKLPRPTETSCAATTARYTLESDNVLEMDSECHLGSPDGPLRSVSALAKVADPMVPAKLSLDFGGVYGDYWIIDLGEHYEWAVVGHPTRDYLWILSRTPRLDPQTAAGIMQRARDKKFDTTRLEYTLQP